ncbi:MAG: 4-hydroxythreonine-4-phosphate dehydrogenase PdxA [Spirochaetales bacterium]|nr:4-hydroxythreonine-4-phosphate dehydrogenase PdxA [Spirochaetales bacterium]
MNTLKPLIGISVGDPAGIGPEITAKALNEKEIYEICRPLVISDLKVAKDALKLSNLEMEVHSVDSPRDGQYDFGTIDVLDMKNVNMDTLVYKTISEANGRASFDYIRKNIELALDGDIDATVTGPIHKEAIKAAGITHAGHTEIYAALTGTDNYAMMLAEGKFRVAHVSTHVSLKEAIERVRKPRILNVIHLANDALKKIGIEEPRIAIAGLNPHAGEHGLFGSEEIDEIIPAVSDAKSAGLNIDGPLPADTVFSIMKGGQYDLVVVMYHDQGHIPAKLSGFNYDSTTDTWNSISGVNITLGLPIIRTSVDHGVAFDKAGEGRANPESMIQAIHMAVRLV